MSGKATVLVVEDEIIIAKDIQRSLQGLGYVVMAVVSSGEEALRKIMHQQPDLALMDIMLQGEMDGIETAELIRNQYDIPIIYLTAYADERMLQRAKITEPFGYMLKPFEDRELHTNIEMALYKHKLERKLRESQQWLSIILNSIGDAVVATDVNGDVTFMNPAAQQLTRCLLEKASGRPLSEIFNIIDNAQNETLPLQSLIKNEKVDIRNHRLLLPDGLQLTISGCTSPLKDNNDRFMGVVITFQDLTELKQVEEALNNQREKFISVLLHDLKTPLIAISGYTRRLLTGKAKNVEEKSEIVTNIQDVSQYLLDTIEETSRSLKEKAELNSFNPQQLQFNKILTAAILNCLPELENRGLSLVINDQATNSTSTIGQITLSGDHRQIKTMIENLMGNATKYARSVVKLNCYKDGTYVRFIVSDDGPGIDKMYVDRIFDAYYQVPGSIKGTGLGLYSVKKVVENHKGTICVKTLQNLGCSFEVTLPL
ncbi:MAG: response regulator [Nitrospirae bacterium]|nr:response regulator [Nitrospirota bacterium]